MTSFSQRDWDAVIVGGGPAGSLMATRLAAQGHRVLLIDKERFPRPKVCGGCLGSLGNATLSEAGIDLAAIGVETTPLSRVAIYSGSRMASLPLYGRRAIARDRFDAKLLDHAATTGAVLAYGCRAKLGSIVDSRRTIEIVDSGGERQLLTAKLVVLAAGLGAERLLPEAERPATHKRLHSRIGAGTTIRQSSSDADPSTVTMACGRRGEGYVGLATLPDGRIDVAAALNPAALSTETKATGAKATAHLAASILKQCELPVPDGFSEATWRATPALTQRPTWLGAERVLFIGDAAGYVEPFTGEGIGWALRSALEVEAIATEAIGQWHPSLVDTWTNQHAATIGRWQRRCRTVCGLIGARGATPLVVGMLRAAPWMAAPLLRRIDPAAQSL